MNISLGLGDGLDLLVESGSVDQLKDFDASGASCTPLVLLFDSMVWDEVLVNSRLQDLLVFGEAHGCIEIVRTHVQIDQNEAMRTTKPVKLTAINGLRAQLQEKDVPTEGFVLGVSRLGQAKLGSDDSNLAFEELMGNQKRTLKNASDALLAVSAEFGQRFFVSGDQRLVDKSVNLGFKVIPLSSFEGWLGSLLASKS